MFQWLNNLFTGRDHLRPAPMLAPNGHPYYPAPSLTDARAQAGRYTQSSWVYVAVSRIAEAAALTPLHVYRVENEQRVGVIDHPLERLLRQPNPFTSGFDLIEQTVGMLELTGNAYWLLSGARGMPEEIWSLRPDRVTIVPGTDSHIRGYLYAVDGVQMAFEPVEVVHFKRWHPQNDYYGLSALQAAALAIDTDRAMSEWNRNTFGRDNGVPSGILGLPSGTSAADLERIRREWAVNHGGTQRRTAFVRGAEFSWQSVAQTHADLDFLRGREANRDEILNVFGIPVGLMSDDATEANAKVAERTFIERTLYPKLVRLAATISAELMPFWEPHAEVAFEDIRPTDTQARISEIRAALPVLSINEVRARFYDLPPVAWGDVPAGRRGVMPTG